VARRAKTKARKKKAKTETPGQRLARLRRARGVTQVELAEAIDVSQPVISMYERGEHRMSAEAILVFCEILQVSADELIGLEPVNGLELVPNRRLARRLQQIARLPQRDQEAIIRTIDAFLGRDD
jgi:transcriptional regulator with XRE-family HTH domain